MNSPCLQPWNKTQRDYPLGRGPHELIEEQVAKTPDSPAVTMGAKRLNYRELDEKANRLAQFLQKQGTATGRVVGVYVDRSIEMVVCFLAILKAGGVYLPLDPKFPQERLAFMLEDAAVPVVLTQAAKKGSLPETEARVIVLDEIEEALARDPADDRVHVNTPDDLAYMIYTSGSTGKPKGVMIPRQALTNFLFSMAERPGIRTRDVLLAVTTISFDISILELLLPLTAGAHTVIATREESVDPKELVRLLERHGITVMQATPTTWRMLVETGWSGKEDLKILCGGEALTLDLVEQLLPRCHELWNMYGPTETTIWSSTEKITSPERISLGPPIANTQFYVVDENLQPVEAGQRGELLIGGDGLARGYLKRAELTAEKFVPDTFRAVEGARLYRTGDEVRYRTDGSLEFLGRLDHQVKLNGFRIELGEIESAMGNIDGVCQAVVAVREDVPGEKRLVGYYTGQPDLNSLVLSRKLKTTLPEYMVPSAYVWMKEFPRTPNAKLDRKALPAPARTRPPRACEYVTPQTALERRLAALWCELLHLDQIGIDDSFFDVGGNSLAAVHMASEYHSRFGRELPLVKVFQYPTIAQLCRFLDSEETDSSFVADAEQRAERVRRGHSGNKVTQEEVAIIGMVGRFPGADNLDQLWRNLCGEVESISFFGPEELGPGLDENLRTDPDYIRARGLIQGAELFDAGFFGVSSLEAKVMDPQQRVFLELAYNALENAGYDPGRYKGLIGVYAGIGDNHYYTTNLLTHPDLIARAGKLAVEYGNQKDYIALRAAYFLDLHGPAVSLNTACSTTLLAVDQAYRALLDYECDIALAGGIDITVPQRSGFPYTEGGTFAKDGHCRPFDAGATGTMFCDGAGLVVLKRLSEAIADGDTIYAVVKGSGKNNNGARPASFLAPSVEGQAEAIAIAQARANVDVETIGYIEAHGTGTPVGDPIEIEALRKVFERKTQKKQFCFIGSIKGNIGHPTNAAGVAGLIKAAMVLHREEIPATLHYKTPNPRIDFENSPFKVANHLIPYRRGETPRRTAVSSFGFGGTNVHVILEEAPVWQPGNKSRPLQLLPISGRTPTVLDAYIQLFASHLDSVRSQDLADVAFTLQTGRKQMAERRFVVAGDPKEAAKLLRQPNPLRSGHKRCEKRDPAVVFLFGGQGTQYVNMGQNLYQEEPLFRAVVDTCCDILKVHLGVDLREFLYPKSGDERAAQISLQDTFYTQPAIFVVEYALARLWQSFGIRPAMMAGHSIGEFVAATLAGVWELEDGLRIIAQRGRLMRVLPSGAMLAVRTSVQKIRQVLPDSIQVASNNAPSLCVVSGPMADVEALRARLEARNIACQHLYTSHAFHSAMMDPVVEPLRIEIAKAKLRLPTQPFVSTVTGRLITEEEAMSPSYWAHHARATVEFSKAVLALKEMGHDVFLECGPRATMCSLARQHFGSDRPCVAVPTLSDTCEGNAEWASMLFALGSLWLNGVSIDWDGFYVHEDRRRIPLPNYPFERQRYWVDPVVIAETPRESEGVSDTPDLGNVIVGTTVTGEPAGPTVATRRDRVTAALLDILVPISGHERAQISTSATFLEQGFDSLSLAQVAFAIRKEFGIKMSFTELMNQFPNVQMVAEHLNNSMADGPSAPPTSLQEIAHVVIERNLRQMELQRTRQPDTNEPTTPAGSAAVIPESVLASGTAIVVSTPSTVPQRGIFFSSRLSDNLSASYNESITLFVKGCVSVPQLTRSLQRLVERHDALRASFDETGSVMRVAPEMELRVPVIDLSGLTRDSERQVRLRELTTEEMARPFALPSGPLFRSQIIVLGRDSAAVIITGHHVICDGWSLDVLIHDWCAFYSEEISGVPSNLGPVSSFASYAAEVVRREHSVKFVDSRRFWANKFAGGLPPLVLPADFPRGARRVSRARRLDRRIAAPIVEKTREMAAKQGCSFFAAILGALSIMLAQVSKQRRFVIALPTADQPAVGKPQLVGHCVGLLPFLVDLQSNESVNEYLTRVQKELGEACDESSFTLVSLLETLRPSTPAQHLSPIPAGLTNVKKFRRHELPQHGFSVDYYANAKTSESFEWYLNAIEDEDGLELHCHYDTGLLKHATVENWLAALEKILVAMAAGPGRAALELAGLTESENVPAPETLFFSIPSAENVEALPAPICDERTTTKYGDTLEEQLRDTWTKILGVNDIGLRDNFFDLGGNSLTAARLFMELKKRFGRNLPISVLLRAPTVEELSALLRTGDSRPWSSLVPMQEQGTKKPFFCVHGAGGNVLIFGDLARQMAPDYPFYALQARRMGPSRKIPRSIQEMAACYLEEIRQVQPKGPYCLGGFCMGGLIAYAMAQILRKEGEEVAFLALIDTYNFRGAGLHRSLREQLLNATEKVTFHLVNLIRLSMKHQLNYLGKKLKVAILRESQKTAARVSNFLRLGRTGIPISDVWLEDRNDKLAFGYVPTPYAGPVTIFKPNRHYSYMRDPQMGWDGVVTGSLKIEELPTAPGGIFVDPYVQVLAEKIKEAIDLAGLQTPMTGSNSRNEW